MKKNIGDKSQELSQEIVKVYDNFNDLINSYSDIYRKITNTIPAEHLIMEQIVQDKRNLFKESSSVVVIGETNVGKSQFVNLLLGDNILGVDQSTETAVLTTIKAPVDFSGMKVHFFPEDYVENLKERLDSAEIEEKVFIKRLIKKINNSEYLNGHLGSEPIDIVFDSSNNTVSKSLRRYTSAQGDASLANVVHYVELFYETEISASDIEIVDSPGLNDANPLRPNLTKNYLLDADVILLMIGNDGVKKTTRDTVRYVLSKQLADKLIFIANKVDAVDDFERFMSNTKNKIYDDIFEILVLEVEESEVDKEQQDLIIDYIDRIKDKIEVFPLSAKEAFLNRNLTENKYVQQYEKLILYLNEYLQSDDYVRDKAIRYLSKYGNQIYTFNGKISNSINAIISGNLKLAQEELSQIKEIEDSVKRKSGAILGRFKTTLTNRVKSKFSSVTDEYKSKTKEEAWSCLINGDISSWWPKKRAKKAKLLIEDVVQPSIRSNIKEYEKKLNREIENIANEELAKLDEEFKKMVSAVQREFEDRPLSLRSYDPEAKFDFDLAGGILLQAGGITVITLGGAIVTAIVSAVLAAPIAIVLGILVTVGGVFGTLFTLLKGGDLVAKGRKMFREAKEGKKLKEEISGKINAEIDRIFKKIGNEFKADKISDEIIKEIEKQIALYFAQMKDPLIIALEAGGDTGISDKFKNIKVGAKNLLTLFEKLKGKYSL